MDAASVLALPSTRHVFTAGDYLVRYGEIPTSCHLLLTGFAQRNKLLPDGSRQIIGLHIAGDLVDFQYSLLGRATHNVQLLTPAKVLEIPVGPLVHLMRSRPAVAEAIWRNGLTEACVFEEWIVNIGRRDARSRIAHLFCEIGIRQEQVGLGSRSHFDLPLSQEQLGDALGLTAVHVNRVLRRMEAEKLAWKSRRSVKVFDWDRLAAVGDFSGDYLDQRRAGQGGL
ncbi:Crp/Fnr family transcriptional regulator [Sphingomonas colocasiae]|uniref:Crp/Fnr family transcriptional regulator n=1 Tax=Sphingomonas colocasiae TaxID=1848973 RepID=A0ABS7PQC7_9SPHN|nr:Crp/Fnr family transcriptional regulator [Sphingomonas colocasiae]MBY8823428.1 Crp/Fnr family transcriptional regulator [Sphingomonas colocasiae]